MSTPARFAVSLVAAMNIKPGRLGCQGRDAASLRIAAPGRAAPAFKSYDSGRDLQPMQLPNTIGSDEVGAKRRGQAKKRV
jgi:hypothetical protein